MTRTELFLNLGRGYMPEPLFTTTPVTFPDTNTWENELKRPVEKYPTYFIDEITKVETRRGWTPKVANRITVPDLIDGLASIDHKRYTKKQIYSAYWWKGYRVVVGEGQTGYTIILK